MMTIVLRMNDMFGVSAMARCYQFVGDLNDMAPVNNLCELRW